MRNYIAQEPVRFWAAITGIVVAAIPVLALFGIVELTTEQIAGVITLLTAVGVLFQFFFVRQRVTPTQ